MLLQYYLVGPMLPVSFHCVRIRRKFLASGDRNKPGVTS